MNLSIGFDNSHYHHIAGLHKLKDIDQLRLRRRRSTAVIFDEILRGKITLATHRFKILHKEKINIKTGENKVLFSSLENK